MLCPGLRTKSCVLLVPLIILFLSSFKSNRPSEIVLINTDAQYSAKLGWQKRRTLSLLIEKLPLSKAIAVTSPCIGYTSPGADQALLNVVKKSGNVYFGLPLWDAMYPFAKGIGHVEINKEGSFISIPRSFIYEAKEYAPLCLILAKDYFNKVRNDKVAFNLPKALPFEEYNIDEVIEYKSPGIFKDKILFVGDRVQNLAQAAALYYMVYGFGPANTSRIFASYIFLISAILCIALIIYAVKRPKINRSLPLRSGGLSFGVSGYKAGGVTTSILDTKTWAQGGHYWLWLADFNAAKEHKKTHMNNIRQLFYQLNNGFGPREAVIRLNDFLYRHKNNSFTPLENSTVSQKSFLTGFTNLLFLDVRPDERRLRFSNAGFESPLLFINSTKEFRKFPDVSPPLGIKSDIIVDEHEIKMEKSDILVLFNSGVVGLRDNEGRLMDLEQLKFLITQNYQSTSRHLADRIIQVILNFSPHKPNMDMLVVAIKAN